MMVAIKSQLQFGLLEKTVYTQRKLLQPSMAEPFVHIQYLRFRDTAYHPGYNLLIVDT